MCNANCFEWTARNFSEEEISGKRMLEVGSYDVNGSLRRILAGKASEYIGTDIEDGPGVDIVCPAQQLVERFGKESFDIVLSTGTLEHVEDWRGAVDNMKAICKRGGIILIIVPSKWAYHPYPGDYWRYRPVDIQRIFSDCVVTRLDEDPEGPSMLVYAKIRKPNVFVQDDLSKVEVPMAPREK